MYGQNVYVTMGADGSSAHYRMEEGDFTFRTGNPLDQKTSCRFPCSRVGVEMGSTGLAGVGLLQPLWDSNVDSRYSLCSTL